LAVTAADYFATPLGEIPLDREGAERLSQQFSSVQVVEKAFDTQENSLETEMPFLQATLKHFTLLPILIGQSTYRDVAEILKSVWGEDETLLVVSSDLSHYLDDKTARKVDHATIEAILNLRPYDIGEEQACGRVGIQALLSLASEKSLQATLVDYSTSGDTAGNEDHVVGYAAVHFRGQDNVIPRP
jgi:hypothetical protein